MNQKLTYSPHNGSVTHKNQNFPIGHEGNMIEIDNLGHGEYRLICRDHFSQNFIDYYVHRDELERLVKFMNDYLENN